MRYVFRRPSDLVMADFFVLFNLMCVFFFVLQDQLIINVIIEQMISDPDSELGMAVQLSSILRLLLDPENMLAASMVNVSL